MAPERHVKLIAYRMLGVIEADQHRDYNDEQHHSPTPNTPRRFDRRLIACGMGYTCGASKALLRMRTIISVSPKKHSTFTL